MSQIKTIVKKSEYHDSVSLMLVAQELARLPGVSDAAVVMATEANKGILSDAGMVSVEIQAATPNDLVIVVKATQDASEAALDGALAAADNLLYQRQKTAETLHAGGFAPKTFSSAFKSAPQANLAVISVAGRYAAAEAWEALRQGVHVLLFSDNVSVADEIALKSYAVEHGLLLMGPGAGTAILNGVALGFANVLPSGPVGIVSAAGTGLQEVSSLLARLGVGITQGIGTGGRDLKEEVGGRMMLAGLQALQEDPATQVIVLISKPASPVIASKVLDQVAQSAKPAVVCFLGLQSLASTRPAGAAATVRFTHTLEETAILAAQLALGRRDLPISFAESPTVTRELPLASTQHDLRALFSGGTLCYEAQGIWRDRLPEPVWSNAPLDPAQRLPDANRSQGHTAIDLGEEEFPVGRLHPMIDNTLRIRRLLQEAQDPQTAVIMLDVVLGYGAHPDPASELGPAIRQARQIAHSSGRELAVVASVTGTEADPQCRSRQVQALQQAGAFVCESNTAASRLSYDLLVQSTHLTN